MMAAASVPFAERRPFKPREPPSPTASTSIVPTKARSRQTTFNSGVRGGLFEKKHSDAMGESIFLFGWLVTRQTKSDGLVFGGHAFTYPEISEESGWPVRTLERWMARLRAGGYVRVKHTTYCRMIIWVLNPKKFSPSTPPEMADLNASPTPPTVADSTARSGGLKHRSVIGSKKSPPPTPPLGRGALTISIPRNSDFPLKVTFGDRKERTQFVRFWNTNQGNWSGTSTYELAKDLRNRGFDARQSEREL